MTVSDSVNIIYYIFVDYQIHSFFVSLYMPFFAAFPLNLIVSVHLAFKLILLLVKLEIITGST